MSVEVFLSRPPEQRPAEQLLWDAIEILLPSATLSYERILVEAAAFGRGEDKGQRAELDGLRQALLTDIMAMIGTIERLRKLVAKLGGGGDLRIAKRAFLAAVGPSEPARHHLEHLDGAVEKLVAEPIAALAMFSWWETTDTGLAARIVVPGLLRVGMQPGVKIPSEMRGQVDHVTAFIAGEAYNLSAGDDAIQALWQRLRAWSAQWADPSTD